jgi:hypothetical protein
MKSGVQSASTSQAEGQGHELPGNGRRVEDIEREALRWQEEVTYKLEVVQECKSVSEGFRGGKVM